MSSPQQQHNTASDANVKLPTIVHDIPTTPHRAYVAGMEASRRGDDLATVVYDALLRWPMDSLPELAELITNASLGYWVTEGRLS